MPNERSAKAATRSDGRRFVTSGEGEAAPIMLTAYMPYVLHTGPLTFPTCYAISFDTFDAWHNYSPFIPCTIIVAGGVLAR